MRLFLLLLLLFSFEGPGFPIQESGNIQESNNENNLQQELKLDTSPPPGIIEFDEGKMDSFKNDPEFDYSESPQENWWSQLKRYIALKYEKLLHWLFGDYQANDILLFFVELLPYLVILTVISLAIWLFNKMNPAAVILNDPAEGRVFLSEEEEIIKSSNITELIEKAVAQKNYRLAIRYSFLLILQQLKKREMIAYEFSKTDQEYVSEIKENSIKQQFKHLTKIYDFVWYGNFDATEAHYNKSQKEFEKMQDLIQKS